MKTWRRLIPALLAGVFLLASCATTATGRRGFFLISPEQEAQLGARLAQEMMQQLPVNRDSALNQYVNAVGQRIVAVNDYKAVPYTFTIIDDDKTVNAFALPGGYEFVYTGLLRRLSNEAELAAIIGHETGHVAARHGAEKLSIQYGTAILSSLVLGNQSPVWVRILNDVATFSGILAYSRSAENDADRLGVIYSARASYDPEAMVGVMQKFVSLQKREPSALETFFSDHPAPQQRIPKIREQIAKLPPSATGRELAADRFSAAISGIRERSQTPAIGYPGVR